MKLRHFGECWNVRVKFCPLVTEKPDPSLYLRWLFQSLLFCAYRSTQQCSHRQCFEFRLPVFISTTFPPTRMPEQSLSHLSRTGGGPMTATAPERSVQSLLSASLLYPNYLSVKHHETILRGLAKRSTPLNILLLLFAAEHGLGKLGAVIDPWQIFRERSFQVLGRRLTRFCVKSQMLVLTARSGWNLWKLMELGLRMKRKWVGRWPLFWEEPRMRILGIISSFLSFFFELMMV